MKIVSMCCIALFFVACSAKTSEPSPGAIARQIISCASPEACEAALHGACPAGGVIHAAAQTLTIEFSCHAAP